MGISILPYVSRSKYCVSSLFMNYSCIAMI